VLVGFAARDVARRVRVVGRLVPVPNVLRLDYPVLRTSAASVGGTVAAARGARRSASSTTAVMSALVVPCPFTGFSRMTESPS
jgi:hypothetical protein